MKTSGWQLKRVKISQLDSKNAKINPLEMSYPYGILKSYVQFIIPTQSAEGAHLSWEPPANSAGTISEYSVYLGLKPQPGAQPGTMAFAR